MEFWKANNKYLIDFFFVGRWGWGGTRENTKKFVFKLHTFIHCFKVLITNKLSKIKPT